MNGNFYVVSILFSFAQNTTKVIHSLNFSHECNTRSCLFKKQEFLDFCNFKIIFLFACIGTRKAKIHAPINTLYQTEIFKLDGGAQFITSYKEES